MSDRGVGFGGAASPPSIQREMMTEIEGVPIVTSVAQIWDQVRNFKARPDDVLIATYPKAGTTWMIEIVDCVMNDGDTERCKRSPTHDRAPFIERNFTKLLPLVPWGSWFDHVTGWWESKAKHRVLYLFYEDLKEDPAREIDRVARFLGKGLDQAVIDRIADHTSFLQMKENPMANYSTVPSFIFNQAVSPFMRKGTVGDWKQHFTVSQSERFDEEYRRRLAGTSLRFRTEL
ncbi:sulfotransferase 1C4-like [Huso huso]|uniref:Sulfotransferase n=1 Tax=Huso huso TaxID=61971 RepID=A0ABR0Y5H9_HUSHU